MSSKKQLVLFDVGGVLLELNYSRLYKSGAKITNQTSEQFKKTYLDSKLESDVLKGKISDKEYQQKLKIMLGNPRMSRAELEDFVKNSWGKEITPVVDLKEKIYFEAETPVGIFSNINQFAFEYLSRIHPRMFQTFNPEAPAIYSYLAGDVKPGEMMYRQAETQSKKLGIDKVILIEDKASYLLAGAEEFGWNGILFTPYIDKAEAIRIENGHDKIGWSHKNIKIADSVKELEQALKGFGVPLK